MSSLIAVCVAVLGSKGSLKVCPNAFWIGSSARVAQEERLSGIVRATTILA